MNRKKFLQSSALAIASTSILSKCNFSFLPNNSYSGKFTGDNFSVAHKHLWNIDEKEFQNLKVDSELDLIVVGGGLSGLSSAYMSEVEKILVLEQAKELGGNAKSQEWGDLRYAIGSAYFTELSEDDPVLKFYKDMGMDKLWTKIGERDEIYFHGNKLFRKLNEIDDAQMKLLPEKMKKYSGNRFPYLPYSKKLSISEQEFKYLDNSSLTEVLKKDYGSNLSPALISYLETYARASFGSTASEMSAYAFLNFISPEFESHIYCFQGGNNFTVRLLTEKLLARKTILKTSNIVLSVQNKDKQVEVISLDLSTHSLKKYLAKKVILGAQKFVAKRIVKDIPKNQLEAMNEMKYRTYFVANVLLKNRPKQVWYDAYFLNTGDGFASDVVLADYATDEANRKKYTALTIYMPYAMDGKRAEVLSKSSSPELEKNYFQELKSNIATEIARYQEKLEFKTEDIYDINITRWGHALILAGKGQFSRNVFTNASAPIGNIFFANQDKIGVPCVEAAFTSAMMTASEAGILNKKFQ